MIPSLISYVAMAVVFATTLLLFLSSKREMRTHVVRERKRLEALLGAMAPQLEPVYIPVTMRSGLNVNNRIQALRMLRRGESAAHAAAVLGVAACEIELLYRVEAIVSKAPATLSAS
jgi:hypothetical protein